jgi:excisionase family DNA binding protein
VSWLTVKQVAEQLQVSEATVYQLCGARQLGHVRVGKGRGTIRVSEEHLDAYMQRASVQPVSSAKPTPVAVKVPEIRLKHLTL